MSDAKIIARSLLKQAEQIAEAGHAGWGNLDRDAADLIEQQATRIAEFERILDGLPQDAIDGGWTARGISTYAKKLEGRIAELEAQIASLSKSAATPTPSSIEATAALIANGLVGQASEEDVREVERLINELLRGE